MRYNYSWCSFANVCLTFCKTPVICSYLPVESGKFSKLIKLQIFFENFSDGGNLLYGDVLCNTGVPKSIDFTLPWLVLIPFWRIRFNSGVISLLGGGISDFDIEFEELLFDEISEFDFWSSTSSCFFIFSNSDNDGEFARKEGDVVSSWNVLYKNVYLIF